MPKVKQLSELAKDPEFRRQCELNYKHRIKDDFDKPIVFIKKKYKTNSKLYKAVYEYFSFLVLWFRQRSYDWDVPFKIKPDFAIHYDKQEVDQVVLFLDENKEQFMLIYDINQNLNLKKIPKNEIITMWEKQFMKE